MVEPKSHEHQVKPDFSRGFEQYRCPLCDWVHVEAIPNIDNTALEGIFGYGTMAAVGLQQKRWRVEEELDKHFRTHTTVQWLAKVTELQGELRRLKEQFA